MTTLVDKIVLKDQLLSAGKTVKNKKKWRKGRKNKRDRTGKYEKQQGKEKQQQGWAGADGKLRKPVQEEGAEGRDSPEGNRDPTVPLSPEAFILLDQVPTFGPMYHITRLRPA